MLDWIKKILGIEAAKLVLSLEERHAKANELQEDAISSFDRIVADLEEAASTLGSVAVEAEAQAAAFLAQHAKALEDAAKAQVRAGKIRELLG